MPTLASLEATFIDRRSLSFAIIIFTQPPPGQPPGHPSTRGGTPELKATVTKLSTYILGLNIRLFYKIGKIEFPPPLELGGVKSAIGLIFKMLNFKARVMKLSRYVIGLNIRLSCQIGKI